MTLGTLFKYVKIRRRVIIGVLIIIINNFVFYYRRDIVVEFLRGRPLDELDIYKLLLPSVLFATGLFLIFKKNRNGTPKNTA